MEMSLKVNMKSKLTPFTFLIHDSNLTANDSSVIPKTKMTGSLFVCSVLGLYLLWSFLLSDAPLTGNWPIIVQLDCDHLTQAALDGVELQCVC